MQHKKFLNSSAVIMPPAIGTPLPSAPPRVGEKDPGCGMVGAHHRPLCGNRLLKTVDAKDVPDVAPPNLVPAGSMFKPAPTKSGPITGNFPLQASQQAFPIGSHGIGFPNGGIVTPPVLLSVPSRRIPAYRSRVPGCCPRMQID